MRAMRKLLGAALGLFLVATGLVLATSAPANAADSGAEAQFVSRLNSIRSQHGLQPLAVYGELVGVARGWTDQMVANGGISHNPGLAGEVSANWSKLGENVGYGGDVDTLVNMFVASPAHYKNIVDPAFNYIGVGVSYDSSGRLYTTHDFMALNSDSGSGSAPEPAPAPAPRHRVASAPAAPDPEPVAAPEPPPPPPPPPATPARVNVMLTALRAVGA